MCCVNSHAIFKQEASEAYEVLSDEQKRREYDTFGSSPSGTQQQQHNPFSQTGRQGNIRWEYKVGNISQRSLATGESHIVY